MKVEIISSEKIPEGQTHHVNATVEHRIRIPSAREQHDQGIDPATQVICSCAGCGVVAGSIARFNGISCSAREAVWQTYAAAGRSEGDITKGCL